MTGALVACHRCDLWQRVPPTRALAVAGEVPVLVGLRAEARQGARR
jgi:hypothetical protein